MKVCSVCQRCYEDDVLSCVEENHNSFDYERAEGREVIAGFRLDFLIESGATGKTYKATDIHQNQACLILIRSAEGQNLNQQFLNEAKSIAALNHPNLVSVYQFGELASGEFYLVTEEADGQTLRDFLSKIGVPSEITAIQVARQIAEGLEALHKAGLTHRNINPENIILTSDAEHRLLIKIQNFDFGGINQQITTSDISNSADRLNNLRYFSPEQCTGQTVDAQTDIYGLGIVLYEMLAGVPPFDAPDADALIDKQIKMPPPEIKIANFDIRALLTYTLMDSLQKIPRLRLKKAGAFARQLRHIEQLITHSPAPPPVMATQPAANKAIAAELPKTPKIEVAAPTTDFRDSIQSENFSPISAVPEMTEIVEVVPTNEPPVLPLQEPVIEIIAAESEINAQPESVQPEPIFVEEAKIDDIPPVSVTHLVEWEQPEDIPSQEEVLEVHKEEFGDSEFTAAQSFIDDEFITDEHITYEPPTVINIVIEQNEIKEPQESAVPIFSQYSDNQSHRFPIANQLPLIGAGLVILIILGVMGSLFLRRQSQTAHLIMNPATQSTPAEKVLTKPEETDVAAKEEIEPIPNFEESDSKDKTTMKDISDSSAPKISDAKKRPNLPTSSAKRANENQPSKEISDNKAKPNESNVKEEPLNKNVIIVINSSQDKKPTISKQSPVATKPDGLTRPRIVKTRVIP